MCQGQVGVDLGCLTFLGYQMGLEAVVKRNPAIMHGRHDQKRGGNLALPSLLSPALQRATPRLTDLACGLAPHSDISRAAELNIGAANGSHRDAARPLAVEHQGLGNQLRRLDRPGTDDVYARLACRARQANTAATGAVHDQPVYRDTVHLQIATAGEIDVAAHALHTLYFQRSAAAHDDAADPVGRDQKMDIPEINIPLLLAGRLCTNGKHASRHVQRYPVQCFAAPCSAGAVPFASDDGDTERGLHAHAFKAGHAILLLGSRGGERHREKQKCGKRNDPVHCPIMAADQGRATKKAALGTASFGLREISLSQPFPNYIWEPPH